MTRGRKPQADRGAVKAAVLSLRLTADERAQIDAAAAAASESAGDWARRVLLAAALAAATARAA